MPARIRSAWTSRCATWRRRCSAWRSRSPSPSRGRRPQSLFRRFRQGRARADRRRHPHPLRGRRRQDLERLKAKAAKRAAAPDEVIAPWRHRSGRERTVSTYCYQCVAGPDLLKVRIEDDVATEIAPNFDAAEIHPAGGKACVKAFGLVQKLYNPAPHPASDEADQPEEGPRRGPGLRRDLLGRGARPRGGEAQRARARAACSTNPAIRALAASFGGGGTPTAYMGTLPAFLAAWGPVDMSFGSGQGVKCYHSEHLYGELWHRAFTVSPDTPLCEYLVSFGANVEASGGVCGVKRHADARKRGMKRVQIEPHLSVTGACSAEWIPIKPKTDAAFLFAMIHVLLHEHPRERLDLPFLKNRTSSPYLVGPNGFFLRDPDTRKPLVIDAATGRAVPFDTAGIDPALEGDVHRRRRRGRPGRRVDRLIAPSPVTPGVRASRRAREGLFARMGGPDLRRRRAARSAASPTSSSITPASARRSRSRARPCRCGRSRSRSARPSTTAGAATNAAGRARCSPAWSARSRCRAARSAPPCGSTARPTIAGRASSRARTASWTIR